MNIMQAVALMVFSSALLPLLQATNDQQPSEIITELSNRINASTLLFYCCRPNGLCDQVMREQKGPKLHLKLQLTTNHTLKLREFYYTNIIAIVILKRNNAAQLHQLRGLEKTLLGR